ncbi:hypothetical protein BCR42DRAFT_403016 [Absidia repens]|uniref:Uncharacterized protein n=1 Tax=Absidia repens TaxID=90262 RepID=A0A1X2IYT7_9FUNG|nr:hypothetical protein BCR42DRAFT_403016 [Absidia repens]
MKRPMEQRQKLPILAKICCKCPTSSPDSPTNFAARPKKVLRPVPITTASASPCLTVDPEKISSPASFVTGSDSPVKAAWSMETSPWAVTNLPSAGTTSPSLILTISPGTNSAASFVSQTPLRLTLHSGARDAMSALTALPAFRSSKNPIVAFASSKRTIPIKSSQSGGRPPPLETAIATMAAASITQDNGFHMKPRNIKMGFCSLDSRRLCPNFSIRDAASSSVRPSVVVCNRVKTSPGSIVDKSNLSLS